MRDYFSEVISPKAPNWPPDLGLKAISNIDMNSLKYLTFKVLLCLRVMAANLILSYGPQHRMKLHREKSVTIPRCEPQCSTGFCYALQATAQDFVMHNGP